MVPHTTNIVLFWIPSCKILINGSYKQYAFHMLILFFSAKFPKIFSEVLGIRENSWELV